MGVVPPAPGLPGGPARRSAREHGALLIFDEVITGFRVAYGGAQERYGVRARPHLPGQDHRRRPAGRRLRRPPRRHEQVAPLGGVYQAGTLSGNPLAVAAGLADARLLREPGAYERLELARRALADGSGTGPAGVPTVNRVGSMLTAFTIPSPVRSIRRRAAPTPAVRALLPRHARSAACTSRPRSSRRPCRRWCTPTNSSNRRSPPPRSSPGDGAGGGGGPYGSREPPLWRDALVREDAQPRFAETCPQRHLLGVEMIYEGHLLHRGRSAIALPGRSRPGAADR